MRRRGIPVPPRRPRALWAIIYIDLMTQIMVFFVIIWSVERREAPVERPAAGLGAGMGDQTVRMVNLPSDILFASGKAELGPEGREVFGKLFGDPASGVLDFDQGGLARRKLAIHGHTDDVGDKDENFLLGYQRAWNVYQEIRKYSGELPDHVVICTHADNTPARVVPDTPARPSEEQRAAAREARAKNRRITIEDIVVGVKPAAE
ncbi:MAG TPA: flagellar motor protein MotB [Kofleriaceae bacterium]|nr:flagellar motor protein MotB [Kofleriaceae bacterium]